MNIVEKSLFGISEGSAATVYRWGGQVYKVSVSSFFSMSFTKIIKIG